MWSHGALASSVQFFIYGIIQMYHLRYMNDDVYTAFVPSFQLGDIRKDLIFPSTRYK